MSSIKFSQLQTLTNPPGDTVFPVVSSGTNYKVTLDTVKASVSLSWSNVTGKPTFNNVAFSGLYADLSGKPTIPVIPTLISAFTNDRGYLTSVDYTQIGNAPQFAALATSGNWLDIVNKPNWLNTTDIGYLYSDGSGTLSFQSVHAGGSGNIIQSATAPATTSTSTLWYDTVGGRSYVYFDDSWVDASPIPTVDTTQIVNNGYSLGIDSAGVINLPTFAGSPSIAIVQTASARIDLNVNGSHFGFNLDGSLTWPNSSVQTGASISIADLKTLVAASTSFTDFQARIAAL